MGIFNPRHHVELMLGDRRELISRSEDQLGRRLQFKARTLRILEINGERILDGQVIVHDERIRGHNDWEGRDLPGQISYLEAYEGFEADFEEDEWIDRFEGEPARYLVQLWLDGPTFEDLRTCDLGTSTVELYAHVAHPGGNPDAIKIGLRKIQWDAKITPHLVLKSTTIWINPRTEQTKEPESPQPEMSSFQRQILEALHAHGQTLTWMFYLLAGLLAGLFAGLFAGLLFMGRGCH